MSPRVLLCALSVCLLVCACSSKSDAPEPSAVAEGPSAAPESQPASGSAQPGQLGPETAGGLAFHGEAPLVRRPPSSGMRAAEYIVSEAPDAPLTVFFFPGSGGGVDENIKRWIGQFTQADGANSAARAMISQQMVGDLQVARVKLKGSYSGGMAMPGRPAPEPITEALLLGAIANGPGGLVFFKWVGPEQVLSAHEKDFNALVASLRPAG